MTITRAQSEYIRGLASGLVSKSDSLATKEELIIEIVGTQFHKQCLSDLTKKEASDMIRYLKECF